MSGFSDFQQKNTGWRTMLVVPELEFELEMLAQTYSIRKEISKLRMLRDVLEDKLQSLEWALRFHNLTVEEQHTFQEKIEILQVRDLFLQCATPSMTLYFMTLSRPCYMSILQISVYLRCLGDLAV
jgi:hypothetical protein